ncbi:MAG: 50S ribosomal protein L4 [Holosporaceae bacterium]
MEIAIQNLAQKKVGTHRLNDAVFGCSYRSDILARVVRWQLAKRQAGTHASKGISDISGTTRKPHKQKGTGRARQGSLRSPQFRGGAVIFGPQPRSHAFALPKKIRQMGLKIAVSGKASEKKISVFDKFVFSSGKTKELKDVLAGYTGRVLCVAHTKEGLDAGFVRAASNMWRVNMLPQMGLNVYDILRHDHIIFEEEALKSLEERLG